MSLLDQKIIPVEGARFVRGMADGHHANEARDQELHPMERLQAANKTLTAEQARKLTIDLKKAKALRNQLRGLNPDTLAEKHGIHRELAREYCINWRKIHDPATGGGKY